MKEAGDDDDRRWCSQSPLESRTDSVKARKRKRQETATIGARIPKRTHDPLEAVIISTVHRT